MLGGPVGVGGCIDVDEVGEMGKATGWLLGVFFFFFFSGRVHEAPETEETTVRG